MRSSNLLWLLGLLTSSCADSGHTSTRLVNTTNHALTVQCFANPSATVPTDAATLQLRQAHYHADTCFVVAATGKLLLVKTLAVGDSLDLGAGYAALFNLFTIPPLGWDSVTVRPTAGQTIQLTPANLSHFVSRTYEESYYCCGEYLRLTTIYRVALP